MKSTQCTATAKRSGKQCIRLAILGGTVCPVHGGSAPQVRRAAEVRVALAEALESADRRPPWEVLADALHTADVLMAQARVRVIDGEPVTVEQVDRLVDAIERAHRMAKVNMDAAIDERRALVAEAHLRQFHQALGVFLAGLALSDEQRERVPVALRSMRLALEGKASPSLPAVAGVLVASAA